MELEKKLKILGAAARYDVSCSSSGNLRHGTAGQCYDRLPAGVCHSWSDDGRCISLLKVLFTNSCTFDCAYCVNRASVETPRAAFTPRELAELTANFHRRNLISGLFLSSSVIRDPDHTMELLLQTVKKLRQEYGFKGYIHMKAIPGANPALIAQAGLYVDRMSVNIELPSEASLRLLAPQKNREKIILPMREIASGIIANQQERKHFAKAPIFVPAGQTTQLIIGASPENDLHIIQLAEDLYHKFKLRRVYYSAFIPVSSDPRLPRLSHPPLLREHRLYQADWLLRLYHFSSTEILDTYHPYLDEDLDPKSSWALRNLQFFPVEVNEADYETLLRVPGIGIKSARKILIARKFHSLDFSDLKKMGVVWKRARYFITCNGRYFANATLDPEGIRERIKLAFHPVTREEREGRQLTLLAGSSSLLNTQDAYSSVTGEL